MLATTVLGAIPSFRTHRLRGRRRAGYVFGGSAFWASAGGAVALIMRKFPGQCSFFNSRDFGPVDQKDATLNVLPYTHENDVLNTHLTNLCQAERLCSLAKCSADRTHWSTA